MNMLYAQIDTNTNMSQDRVTQTVPCEWEPNTMNGKLMSSPSITKIFHRKFLVRAANGFVG